MADKKITQLTELTDVIYSDIALIVDDPAGTPDNKKCTAQNLVKGGASQGAVSELIDSTLTASKVLVSDANGKITISNTLKEVDWGDISEKIDNYTLQNSDNGKVITVNKTTDVTITIPDTLSAEFSCTVIQIGVGQVTFTGSGSMTVRNRQSHTKTAGQYGAASLYVYAANNVLLQGDTAA